MRSGFGTAREPEQREQGAARFGAERRRCFERYGRVLPAVVQRVSRGYGAGRIRCNFRDESSARRLVAVAVAPDPSMCSFSCIARVVMPPVNAAGKLKRRQGTQVVDGRATRPLLWISQRPIPPRASAPRQAGLRLRSYDPRVNALEERPVAPFYLQMMGANARDARASYGSRSLMSVRRFPSITFSGCCELVLGGPS